jgi:hypothetical protein
MATIRSTAREKIFTIKRWYGLNENPDGDTKLKYGEASVMRNWKVTRDGNLKLRDGSEIKMGLCQTYTLLTESTVQTPLDDDKVILEMYPNAAAEADGKITLSGTAAYVTPENAGDYIGYFWRQSKYRYWKLTEYDSGAWKMQRIKTVHSSLNPNVAGLWAGMVQNEETVLAACDGKLWRLYTESGGWEKTSLGSVDTTGSVHIFGFGGNAYILDGVKYRMYDGNSLTEPAGYAPVISISTAPAGGGTELEQINKLNAKRRVWFSPDGTATVFQLPEKNLASIDAVTNRATGEEITGTTINTTNGTVTFSSAPAAGTNTIEVSYTASASDRNAVEKMRFSELFNGAQDNRVFLYGDGSNKVFYSGIDNDGNPRADYFPDMNVAAIGTDNTPVTGLVRHYSRLMAYKTDSTYTIVYGDITLDTGLVIPGFYVTPVNRAIGNTPMGQARLILNSPRSIHGQDCYEWKNSSSSYRNITADERQANRISDRVFATLADFDTKDCVCWDDDYNQEYYVAEGDRALVHNYASDAWYLYTDFDAKCFMSFHGQLYYGTSNGELRYLDPDERSNGGEPIDAYWESGNMDFGEDYRRKYSAQIWVGLKPVVDSEVYVTVQTDKKATYTEKVVQRKMMTFDDADFSDWSFSTNHRPFMQRLKIKAKKFTYYKIIFKSLSDNTYATVLAVDMRIRFNGYVR